MTRGKHWTMSSIAYEQLLCNSKQFQQEEEEQDDDLKQCHDIRDEKTGGQRQDKSSQFVFNMWWAVFVTVIIVTLGRKKSRYPTYFLILCFRDSIVPSQ